LSPPHSVSTSPTDSTTPATPWRRPSPPALSDRRWQSLAVGPLLGAGLPALFGIAYIVASGFGKTVSFDHIYPAIVDK